MAVAAAAEVQALLRFLTQDAKIPLAEAMPKIGALRKKGLSNPHAIAEADANDVHDVFNDKKLTKQVINAAKRALNPKKRSISSHPSPDSKRFKADVCAPPRNMDAELTLPDINASVEELEKVQIETNRAPLLLAFGIAVLEFTMPEQPLSSRLSLAQGVVSANSQTKAKSIGITPGPTAEEEGWAKGQPKIKVLGREIPVMRRQSEIPVQESDSQETVTEENTPSHQAFWSLDLEALRKSNGPLAAGKLAKSHGPPIHTPQAARAYLLRSISSDGPTETKKELGKSPGKKQLALEIATKKERAVAMLLQSIRYVLNSWASTLSLEDLDRRAWSWYISVRPEVAHGQPGWGQRGTVELANILKLRRSA